MNIISLILKKFATQSTMIRKLSLFAFRERFQLQQVEQLTSIKFNVPSLQNFNEEILGQSNQMEDVKGHRKGVFKVSSFRIIWHSRSDAGNNISIGLQTIYSIEIKEILMHDYGSFKNLLILKTLSLNQLKYQFKFMGYKTKQAQLFVMLQQLIKQFSKTKHLRQVTNILKQFSLASQEELKSKYEKCLFEIGEEVKNMTASLTNARIVLVGDMGDSYSIPWISINTLTKIDEQNGIGVIMRLKGLAQQVFIGIDKSPNARILQQQILSFALTYSKHPFLGIDLLPFREKQVTKPTKALQIVEIDVSRLNINVLPRHYEKEASKGTINNSFFNEELGLMMEIFPRGQTRQQLWQILR